MTTLAYRIYPKPNGQKYIEIDLATSEQVVHLFDYCQILEAIIFRQGWDFLINAYGYDELFLINQESGWFDCSSLDEFTETINQERENSLSSL